jgi:quercetin dioxygenase-like cupin family protein
MTHTISVEEMESTRVARFKDLTPFKVAYLDAVLPEYRRENMKVIGRGVAERADQLSPIQGDHEYSMTIVRMEANGGVAPHAHPTSEVFMPLAGRCTVFWGESEGKFEQIELGPWDTMSVPVGVMRWFRNLGDETVLLLAMTGGKQSTVTWHPDIVRRVEELGVVRVGDQIMAVGAFQDVDGLKQGDIPSLKASNSL